MSQIDRSTKFWIGWLAIAAAHIGVLSTEQNALSQQQPSSSNRIAYTLPATVALGLTNFHKLLLSNELDKAEQKPMNY